MDYLDFEVEITAQSESGYTVAVVSSPAGEAHGVFEFPFSSLEYSITLVQATNQRCLSSDYGLGGTGYRSGEFLAGKGQSCSATADSGRR